MNIDWNAARIAAYALAIAIAILLGIAGAILIGVFIVGAGYGDWLSLVPVVALLWWVWFVVYEENRIDNMRKRQREQRP